MQKSEGILLFYLLLVAQNFFFSYKGTLIDKKCTIGCFIVRISSILHRSRKLLFCYTLELVGIVSN